MISSVEPKRRLAFINYKIIKNENSDLILKLLTELFIYINLSTSQETDFHETASSYAQEIDQIIATTETQNVAQPGRKRLVFIDASKTVQIQTSVIEFLKQKLTEQAQSWHHIRHQLIIHITGQPPKSLSALIIKHLDTNRCTTLAGIDEHTNLYFIYKLAYQHRDDSQRKATFTNYKKSIFISLSGKTLDISKNISFYRLNEDSVLQEVGYPFTRSPDFDWHELQVYDPVTLEACDEPYMLDPGCKHTFDKRSLQQWIDTKKAKQHVPDCPCCRQRIEIQHIANLSIWHRNHLAKNNESISANHTVRSAANSNNH